MREKILRRRIPDFFAWSALVIMILACGTGLPELRPGMFESPTRTETHGRIVEKHYRRANGPRTIFYSIFEVDGKPVRIPGGFVEFTQYCPVEGIDAVGFTVRGKPPDSGIFILQVYDDKQIIERLCDYGTLALWKEEIFEPCENGWDAKNRVRIKRE